MEVLLQKKLKNKMMDSIVPIMPVTTKTSTDYALERIERAREDIEFLTAELGDKWDVRLHRTEEYGQLMEAFKNYAEMIKELGK